MREGDLDLGPQRLVVFLVHAAFVDHLHELLAAAGGGGEGGDDPDRLQVVGAAAGVGQGRGDVLHEVRDLQFGRGGVQDVEAPGEREECDGEVHGCWVDGGLTSGVSDWEKAIWR